MLKSVKLPLCSSLMLFLCAGLLTGCNRPGQESGPYRVRIPVSQNDGSYHFQDVTLQTVKDLNALSGTTVHWNVNPTVVQNPGGQTRMSGYVPEAQFYRNADGVYIPKNTQTLEMASITYHLEQLRFWDRELGLETLNQWPRAAGIKFEGRTSDPNQAMFSSQADGYLFFPYILPDAPLSLNAGVIAHEHFHSLFYQILEKPLIKSFNFNPIFSLHEMFSLQSQVSSSVNAGVEDANLAAVRGLNEGLADVWGWLYSGDMKFVARSLGKAKGVGNSRDLDRIGFVTTDRDWMNAVEEIRSDFSGKARMDRLLMKSYALGSQVARTLRSYYQLVVEPLSLTKEEKKSLFAQKVIAGLKATDVSEFDKTQWSTSRFISSFAKSVNLNGKVTVDKTNANCVTWSESVEHLFSEDQLRALCQ